jgi:transcriptional regulator with XRE-family HTH domain
MALHRQIPSTHNRRVLTPGETLRVRRERLKWSQREAADRAGINPETVIQIEKDRGVHSKKLDAYKAALDDGEREQAVVTSPDIATSTTDADVEAAVRKERQRFRAYLVQSESTALATLEDVRSRIARLDAEEGHGVQRKRG